ncbi:hypothetical protein CCHR01_01793 [Colletotrichum chrysophilum]|uniref:Uncharacterized protein n=1 Tax=Colletotrichum chrysophilum TaxID=1836956 RepID=A0AAD9EPA1_9PEZI|nr:hypothetical protein CCHR01_01793 [Colletotrichum chrysophilum]
MTGPSNAYIGHGPATLISEEIADIPINPSACLAQGQPDMPYRWEVEEQNRNISPNSMIPQSVADAFNAQNLMHQKMPVLLPQQPFERYSENDNGAAIFAVDDADLRIDELLELRKSLTTPSPADLRHVNFPKQTAPASKGKAKASEITDHQQPLIAREMAKSATMGYRSLIRSMEHFDELEEAYDNHIRKDVLESPAETDATWPVSQEMQYGYIGQAFAAIFDTASFAEKTAALAKQVRIDETNAATQETPAECQTGASKKRKLDHGGPAATKRLETLNTTEATLADPKSTPQKQLRAIIHYDLTDFEAELRQAQKQQEGFTMKAPWGGKTARVWENYDSFAERWNQICLMLKAKASNRVLNAKRDEESRVGRRVIKSSKAGMVEQ